MAETRQLKRSGKPSPLKSLISRCNSKKESRPLPSLGSGITTTPMITHSIVRYNDPYMPHIQNSSSTSLPSSPKKQTMRRITNASTPQLVTHRSRQTGPDLYYCSSTAGAPLSSPLYHSNSTSQLPPLSPPPLSPTGRSARPTWRDMQHPFTYQPASSLSSTDSEDEDDDEPLGLIRGARPFSLLSDASEDGDDDLVPIARLSISRNSVHHMSAAEKYKAKVRARLHMDTATTPLLD